VVVTAFVVASAVAPRATAQPTSSVAEGPAPSPARASAQGQSMDACSDILNNLQGFLLDNGGFTTIDATGTCYTEPTDINDLGQIVGGQVSTSATD
jgi:hypothetical protein